MIRGRAGGARVKLGDIVERYVERVSDPAVRYSRFVGVDHLDSQDLCLHRHGVIGVDELPPTFRYVFREGMVLVPTRRPRLRKCAVAPFDGLTGEKILVLRPISRVDLWPPFVEHVLASSLVQDWNIGKEVGSVTPHFRWSDMAEFEFLLPPLDEQRRLALLLSALRVNVEAARECAVRAEALVASVRERCLRSDRSRPLGELIREIHAGSSPSGTDEPPKQHELGVVRVSAVGQFGFLPAESKKLVNPAQFDAARTIHAGDLLITRANTTELVGRSCLVEATFDNLMLSDKTLRLLPSDEATASYLLEALWTSAVRGQLQSSATGTGAAMKNISQDKLRSIRVPWLAPERQAEAVRAISTVKAAVRKAMRRRDEARRLVAQCDHLLVGEG